MILRYICLDTNRHSPDYKETDDALGGYRFFEGTRFVSNYITRAVRKMKITTYGPYNMLYVIVDKIDSVEFFEITKTLIVHISVAEEEILSFLKMNSKEEKAEWYLSLLERGYRLAAQETIIPVDKLLSVHQAFRRNNYRNEWVFKKMRLPEYDLNIVLKGILSPVDFELKIEAFNLNRTQVILNGTITSTPPDELCFNKLFRRVQIEQGNLIIYDFIDLPQFSIDLLSLTKGSLVISNCPQQNS